MFDLVASRYPAPIRMRIMETPAGFELNANRVAGRVADFAATRLQNYRPDVKMVAARHRGTQNSPDSPAVLEPLIDGDMIFMGPGSPSYAVRQLQGSLAWDYICALHRMGAALVLASAATISIGQIALPVYEIYKVGEDPYWKPGLDFLKPYGLSLSFIPHWNNAEGGSELDTSRCFIGLERFEKLCAQLPKGTTMIGLDEHTGVVIDLEARTCQVIGRSQVHIVKDCDVFSYDSGEKFGIELLGDYVPLADETSGIDGQVWKFLAEKRFSTPEPATEAPEAVQQLVALRQQARLEKNWKESDRLRDQILAQGWRVTDTPQGPTLERS